MTPMETILDSVGSISTSLFGLVTKTVTFVIDQPILLIFFSISIVGSGVALYKKLIG